MTTRTDRIPVAQTLSYLKIRYELRDSADAWALCPLHEEKTPSFHVDLRSGVWFCMGCGQGGSFEELITRIVHDPMAALAVIHRARSLPVEEVEEPMRVAVPLTPGDVTTRWNRFQMVNWMNVAVTEPVAEYLLVKRRFTREILAMFDVRLTEWSEYPVAFPILCGLLVGYVRRRLDSGKPKYRYNTGFDNDHSVAYYSADDSARCLIVEGVLDLMKAAQYGYPRVAALLGWRLSEGKLDRLRERGVDRVICALDSDVAGEAGWTLIQKAFPGAQKFEFPAHRKDVGELAQHEFIVGLP